MYECDLYLGSVLCNDMIQKITELSWLIDCNDYTQCIMIKNET